MQTRLVGYLKLRHASHHALMGHDHADVHVKALISSCFQWNYNQPQIVNCLISLSLF